MSDSREMSSSDLSRRTVLRRAGAAGLLVTPVGGLLAACASGGSSGGSQSNAGTKSAENPFGAKDGTTVNVVVFDGGLGTVYAEKDKTIFNTKHPKIALNLGKTQKIKTQEQPKMSDQPSDLINNSGADAMDMSTLVNE